jgi:hypothetical protein
VSTRVSSHAYNGPAPFFILGRYLYLSIHLSLVCYRRAAIGFFKQTPILESRRASAAGVVNLLCTPRTKRRTPQGDVTTTRNPNIPNVNVLRKVGIGADAKNMVGCMPRTRFTIHDMQFVWGDSSIIRQETRRLLLTHYLMLLPILSLTSSRAIAGALASPT